MYTSAVNYKPNVERNVGLIGSRRRQVPYIPDGGINFCDVRDLVPACLHGQKKSAAGGEGGQERSADCVFRGGGGRGKRSGGRGASGLLQYLDHSLQ